MGSFGLSKTNRLYWLGRYIERVIIEIDLMQDIYDKAIDGPPFDFAEFCYKLEIPNTYRSSDDFIMRFLFDDQDPYSVITSLNRAYDNAIVLRETISSQALAYVQMAANYMDQAATGVAPMLELQSVSDCLYAFRGISDESVRDRNSRYTLKCGQSVERIDLSIRLGYHLEFLQKEFDRLQSRLQNTTLRRDGQRLMVLLGMAPNPDPENNRMLLLDCVENLFTEV